MAYAGDSTPSLDVSTIIKPASEAGHSSTNSILIVGRFGGGKTFSTLTVPLDQKALLLDFDGKAENVKREKPPNVDIASLEVSPTSFGTVMPMYESIVEQFVNKELSYEWVFIDSFTTLGDGYGYQSHGYIKGENQYKLNWDKQDWIKDRIWRSLLKIFSSVKYTVVFAHEQSRSTPEGDTAIMPLAFKQLSEKLPTRFQNYWTTRLFGEGDNISYMWQTRPAGIYDSTTSIRDLPNLVPQDFGLVFNTDWSQFTGPTRLEDAVKNYEKTTGRKVSRWRVNTK